MASPTEERPCPICNLVWGKLIYKHLLTYGNEFQMVRECENCGMVYSSLPEKALNYDGDSIYVGAAATGSGVAPHDQHRLKLTAQRIKHMCNNYDTIILDVGCAQGGLLKELRSLGFRNLHGIDPSLKCVEVCRQQNLEVYKGSITELAERDVYLSHGYDVVVLNHVLEHIPDVAGALEAARKLLKPGGLLYIEVPDANRYDTHKLPWLDFNIEHINHFSQNLLYQLAANCGFVIEKNGPCRLKLPSDPKGKLSYPAFWMVVQKYEFKRQRRVVRDARLPLHVKKHLVASKLQWQKMQHDLMQELFDAKVSEVAVWGCGNYAEHVVAALQYGGLRIAQAIDGDVGKHGKKLSCGVYVQSPYFVNLPIVIASPLHHDAILKVIRTMYPDARVFGLEARI